MEEASQISNQSYLWPAKTFILSNLQARQNEIVTLTDAATDVEELALTMDDDEKVWDGQRDGYPLENGINS